uniref:Uncharacterized protein n=1 Tax=Anguilla anguilla TaxID=7936 RepID=A0A0E9QGK7_ANGAN
MASVRPLQRPLTSEPLPGVCFLCYVSVGMNTVWRVGL